MTNPKNTARRRFLQYAGAGMLASTLAPKWLWAESARPVSRPSPGFRPDVDIELTARTASLPIFRGKSTEVWKYEGRVLKGPKDAVQSIEGSYLGPIFQLKKGQKVRIQFKNALPERCVTHWHGMHVPADMDGHPMYAIEPGQTYFYEFEILNRASTYWFHPHTHDLTAPQVYAGMAGLFIVSDEEEHSLGLPAGEYDIPLVLQDRTFDGDNQLRYVTHPMQRMMGFLGDRIMINGRPDFALDVEARPYRLRCLNGSNSRIYKLAWQDGTPQVVIGTDGGLLEKPERRAYVMLAPGERVDLWVDFSGRKVGSEMVLRSLSFSGAGHMMHGGGHGMGMRGGRGGMGGGRHGMMGRGGMGMGGMGAMMGGALPAGSNYPLLKVRIAKEARGGRTLPQRLAGIPRLKVESAANAQTPRPIALAMGHMSPRLNGRSYEMNNILPIEKIPVNTLQLIDIFHQSMGGGHGMMGMMHMPHPIHLHGQQFQVVSRSVSPEHQNVYDTVKDGYVDSGWKDTVLVMPGERVRILKPFDDFPGRFMYHCHNLEHEDLGMMRDFLVVE